MTSPNTPQPSAIVHFGFGNFHRAHQVVFTADANHSQKNKQWVFYGVSLRNKLMQEEMNASDNVYWVQSAGVGNTGVACIKDRKIDLVQRVFFAPEQGHEVLALLHHQQTKIVTVTITEKGYHYNNTSQDLQTDSHDVAHDINTHHKPDIPPKTLYGFLVRSLHYRKQQGLAPYTIVSCDNLTHNGTLVKKLLCQFAEQVDPTLAQWIKNNVACPNTMVDCIVPALTPHETASIRTRLGNPNASVVKCEPFRQWVIEDTFTMGRPPWHAVGAELVHDVAPYEHMKLRLLNGSHSTLAYGGTLLGLSTVYEGVHHPALRALVQDLMDCVLQTLTLPPEVNGNAYTQALLNRFANPYIDHMLQQIAMDGSVKMAQRIIAPLQDAITSGTPKKPLCISLASWIVYTYEHLHQGQLNDPLATKIETLKEIPFDQYINAFLPYIVDDPWQKTIHQHVAPLALIIHTHGMQALLHQQGYAVQHI